MPKKIRELKAMLRQAGWIQIPGGKGSHTKWAHERAARKLTISGADGQDAGRYQEKDVEKAIREVK